MIKDLISIIVPTFNVEKYLPDFFQSIQNQTYKKFEVIFIDDGSIDSSKKLINDFCLKHKNCKLIIHPTNMGSSAAKNTGMSYINGEYFTFADPDDILSPKLLEIYIKTIKSTNADFVSCKHKKIDATIKYDSLCFDLSVKNKIKVFENDEIFFKFINKTPRPINMYIWNKCFRTKIFQKMSTYPLIANPSISLGDDIYIFCNYASECNKAAIIKTGFYYYYRQRKNSICSSNFDSKKLNILLATNPIKYSKRYLDKKYQKHLNAFLGNQAFGMFCLLGKLKNPIKKDVDFVFKIFKENIKFCWNWKCFNKFRRLTPIVYPFVCIKYKKIIKKLHVK